MEAVYTQLTQRASNLRHESYVSGSSSPTRVLIALAGPPGSGKSTVAAEVVRRLNKESITRPYATVLPMDGFHLTRAALNAMPNREEAIARRGTVWTFNAQGVFDLVKALHESRQDLIKVHTAPSFDHATKDPVEEAIKIDSDVQLVILEGNWLLYDEEPWSQISRLVNDTWFVDVDPDLALQRVAKRHVKSGIETSWNAALHRAKINDMVNGEMVRTKLVAPAVCVQSIEA